MTLSEAVHEHGMEQIEPLSSVSREEQKIEHSNVDVDSQTNSRQYGLGVNCQELVVNYPLSTIIDVVEGNNRDLDLSKLKSLASKRTDFNQELYQHNY